MDSEIKSPVKAIRAFCLECVGNSSHEVNQCPAVNCQLYPFRFGKNPYLKREYTDEQRQALADRLRNSRKSCGE